MRPNWSASVISLLIAGNVLSFGSANAKEPSTGPKQLEPGQQPYPVTKEQWAALQVNLRLTASAPENRPWCFPIPSKTSVKIKCRLVVDDKTPLSIIENRRWWVETFVEQVRQSENFDSLEFDFEATTLAEAARKAKESKPPTSP